MDILHNDIDYTPFERQIVEFVDATIALNTSHGRPTSITKERDWDVIGFIYKGFSVLYPKDAREFEKYMKEVHHISNPHGIKKEGNAMIQHVLEVPEKLYKMINAIFPAQKWNDKKFVRSFAKHYPQLRGYDK
jgi:hypothetical protein